MRISAVLNFLFFSSLYLWCRADDDDDKIWCLIDHVNVKECDGVTNLATIRKEDIQIKDKDDKLALYMEAPNDYTVNINNIVVKKRLPNLAGEIGATLRVPLWQAGAITLDWPVQAYPQKKLFEGSFCDNESGVITDPTFRREYCRYCNLCETGTHAENRVDKDPHHVAQKNATNNVENKCKQVGEETTYSIHQKIHVPGKKEIEAQANGNKQHVQDKALLQKLESGKGKFIIYLQTYSTDVAPIPANQWYPNQKGCECCSKDGQGVSKCQSGWSGTQFNLGNPCPKCNNNYVQSCLKGTPTKVSCHTIEFNFRITNDSSDVDEFKSETDYTTKAKDPTYAKAPVNNANEPETGVALVVGTKKNKTAKIKPTSGKQPCASCPKAKCANAMENRQTERYCRSWWETQNVKTYCCSKCPTVCDK